MSVGSFIKHRTDFLLLNNDQKHNVYNAFLQYAATARFNIQAEVHAQN